MILLVTADAPLSSECARRLAVAGHKIIAARSADEAIVQAARLRPDVVMLDGELGAHASAELGARLGSTLPTILLLNRGGLDDVMAALDAIDVPARARRA
jgi:DNA-binding response OmpR family regulator